MINVNLCAVQPFFLNKYERKIWETLSAALKLELIGTGNQSSCKFFAAYWNNISLWDKTDILQKI